MLHRQPESRGIITPFWMRSAYLRSAKTHTKCLCLGLERAKTNSITEEFKHALGPQVIGAPALWALLGWGPGLLPTMDFQLHRGRPSRSVSLPLTLKASTANEQTSSHVPGPDHTHPPPHQQKQFRMHHTVWQIGSSIYFCFIV